MIKITTWTRKDVAYDLEWENSSPTGKSWSCLWEAPRNLDQHPCPGRNSKSFWPKGFGDLMSQGCDVKSSIGKSSCQKKKQNKLWFLAPGLEWSTLFEVHIPDRARKHFEAWKDKELEGFQNWLVTKIYQHMFFRWEVNIMDKASINMYNILI